MKCPNCNAEVSSKTCRHCGMDILLLKKAVAVSNVLYNRGLKAATANDLSSAMQDLKVSVEFNKMNIEARNLLGLVYFAYGKVSEAIKEWVVSLSYKKEDNLADYYLGVFQKEQKQTDSFSEAAKMYNQAVVYVSQKSEDMAVIQLKKAIEYNDHFVDALNLLALCYLILKDSQKAHTYIDKVLAIDVYNQTALTYFKEIAPNKIRTDLRTKSAEPLRNPRGAYSTYSNKRNKNFKEQLPLSELIFFIIGACCTLAVMFILVIPARELASKEQLTNARTELEDVRATTNNTIDNKDNEIATLKTELENYKTANDKLQEEVSIQTKVQKINTAHSYLQQNRAEDAITVLKEVSVDVLPIETQDLYHAIEKQAYPLVEQDYYSKGKKEYDLRKYADAKPLLEKSIKFALPESTTIDDCFYLLGRIAEVDKDKEQAKIYYENILNNYKNSNWYNTAKARSGAL